jgi:hypothetical protein
LVRPANRRSVPTAVTAGTPKPRTSSGVINEPPPTPVRPTIGAHGESGDGIGEIEHAPIVATPFIPEKYFVVIV